MQIVELVDIHSDLTCQALAICREAFPLEEREPEEHILASIRKNAQPPASGYKAFHFWAVVEQNRVAGIAFFGYCCQTRLGFISYFAVRLSRRGEGVGSQLYQELITQVKSDALQTGASVLGVCFEVEKPGLARNEAEFLLRQRRIRFYGRNGAFVISQIDFIAPPLLPDLPEVAYTLMFHPLGWQDDCLERPVLVAVVDTVAGFGYGLDLQNPYYQRALGSIHG